MWEQYRRALIPTQALIITLCIIFLFNGFAFKSVLFFFFVMQAFSIFGARWAVRLTGKTERARSRRDGLLR